MELYKTFISTFDEEFIKTNYGKENIFSHSEAPAQSEIEVHKHRRDTASYTHSLYSTKREKVLTGGTRVSVAPEKRIPNKKKNIKSLALPPFNPENKRLLNK